MFRAEEKSEAISKRTKSEKILKPDIRFRLALPKKPEPAIFETLFLECSRPKADVLKFIEDWIKLERMGKDAHDVIHKEIKDLLGDVEGKEKILERVCDVPITLMQVFCREVKIAILDKPHGAYYRVRVLDTFDIPLTPPDN